jgi:hypothetical protein
MLRNRKGLPMAGSLTSLIWLSLGAFAIGTEGFMIAGLLPALAHDLDVGLPAARSERAKSEGRAVYFFRADAQG